QVRNVLLALSVRLRRPQKGAPPAVNAPVTTLHAAASPQERRGLKATLFPYTTLLRATTPAVSASVVNELDVMPSAARSPLAVTTHADNTPLRTSHAPTTPAAFTEAAMSAQTTSNPLAVTTPILRTAAVNENDTKH